MAGRRSTPAPRLILFSTKAETSSPIWHSRRRRRPAVRAGIRRRTRRGGCRRRRAAGDPDRAGSALAQCRDGGRDGIGRGAAANRRPTRITRYRPHKMDMLRDLERPKATRDRAGSSACATTSARPLPRSWKTTRRPNSIPRCGALRAHALGPHRSYRPARRRRRDVGDARTAVRRSACIARRCTANSRRNSARRFPAPPTIRISGRRAFR